MQNVISNRMNENNNKIKTKIQKIIKATNKMRLNECTRNSAMCLWSCGYTYFHTYNVYYDLRVCVLFGRVRRHDTNKTECAYMYA